MFVISIIYDLEGQKFGKLYVLRKTKNPNNKKKRTFWLCQCDCGETSIVTTSDLISGKTQQCWKCAHYVTNKYKRKYFVGDKYGKLTIIDIKYSVPIGKKRRTICTCKCDCGKTIERVADKLKKDRLCSCGCARKEIADKMSFDVIGEKFNRLTAIEENKNVTPRTVKCLCECGKTTIVKKTDLLSGHTQSCGCLFIDKTRKSLGETIIEDYLVKHNVNYIFQHSFDDCKNRHILRFDFAILDKNNNLLCLIEYDGKQHYQAIDYFGGEEHFAKMKENDEIKNQYCKDNDIKLFRLSYKLRKIEIENKLSSIIESVTTAGRA